MVLLRCGARASLWLIGVGICRVPQRAPYGGMHMTYDYGDDSSAPAIGDNLMATLEALADKQEGLESEIEELEELIAKKKKQLSGIATKEIPDLLQGITGSLKLEDGRTLEISEKWRASIAGDRAAPATEWMDDHGHGNLVKREFIISFNKEDEAWAKKFRADLERRKKKLNYKVKRNVHPQTLVAWVNERMSEGDDLPKDLFGMFHQKTAKVKRPE